MYLKSSFRKKYGIAIKLLLSNYAYYTIKDAWDDIEIQYYIMWIFITFKT